MAESYDAINSLLALADDQYAELSDDELTDLKLKLADLVDSDEGPPPLSLHLGAPGKLSLLEGKANILMSLVYHGQREWEVYPATNIYLVLHQQRTDQIFLAKPLLNQRRGETQPVSAHGQAPSALEANSWYAAIHRLNLLDFFSDNLLTDYYRLTALYFDLKSNPVRFALESNNNPGNEPVLSQPRISTTGSYLNVAATTNSDGPKPLTFKAQVEAAGATPWQGNIIVLAVDQQPIVIPVSSHHLSGEMVAGETVTLQIDMNEKSKAWQQGNYEVYLDTGNNLVGPARMHVAK